MFEIDGGKFPFANERPETFPARLCFRGFHRLLCKTWKSNARRSVENTDATRCKTVESANAAPDFLPLGILLPLANAFAVDIFRVIRALGAVGVDSDAIDEREHLPRYDAFALLRVEQHGIFVGRTFAVTLQRHLEILHIAERVVSTALRLEYDPRRGERLLQLRNDFFEDARRRQILRYGGACERGARQNARHEQRMR